MPPTLETPRLRLRPLAVADLPDLIRLDSDPEVMRYVGSPAGVRPSAEIEERARTRIRIRMPPSSPPPRTRRCAARAAA